MSKSERVSVSITVCCHDSPERSDGCCANDLHLPVGMAEEVFAALEDKLTEYMGQRIE
ncbi:MAG: hypothetical protein M1274_15340 [Actinobacteria bacterium]|nr:hypothetical protein [Actinomycetota bacterium]